MASRSKNPSSLPSNGNPDDKDANSDVSRVKSDWIFIEQKRKKCKLALESTSFVLPFSSSCCCSSSADPLSPPSPPPQANTRTLLFVQLLRDFPSRTLRPLFSDFKEFHVREIVFQLFSSTRWNFLFSSSSLRHFFSLFSRPPPECVVCLILMLKRERCNRVRAMRGMRFCRLFLRWRSINLCAMQSSCAFLRNPVWKLSFNDTRPLSLSRKRSSGVWDAAAVQFIYIASICVAQNSPTCQPNDPLFSRSNNAKPPEPSEVQAEKLHSVYVYWQLPIATASRVMFDRGKYVFFRSMTVSSSTTCRVEK